MKICHSTQSNICTFRGFWDAAIRYQKTRQLPLWPSFPEVIIEEEVQAGLHFSAYLPDGTLAGYLSVALSDELIWREKERGDAIYIHRMCVNPACKGSNLTFSILEWARTYASTLGRRFVRMDTWADNQRLVNHYVKCGFHHIGDRQLGDVPDLPPHYNNTNLALFQNTANSPEM